MRKLLLLVIFISIFSCKTGPSEFKDQTSHNLILDSLTIQLDSIYSQGSIIGFSAAIVTPNKIIYNKGFGYADVVNDRKYTAQTVQNIGSISKTFIGISLLKAQELGFLKLDDPINDYLPFKVINPNFPETPITIRQLATHTSSILDSDYYGLSYILVNDTLAANEKSVEYFNAATTKTNFEVYLEKVVAEQGVWNKGDSFANYSPGSMYNYSNVAATLAALVVEKASGISFNEFTKKYILQPLKMNSSGWNDSEIKVANRSRSFFTKDTLLAKYELITYPDGGMITSTENLSIYLMELMKGMMGAGKLLTSESYTELFTRQLSKEQLPEGSQEGNSGIFMDFGKRGIGHSGGDPGIVTFMYFNPQTNIGKILFMNTDYEEDRSVILDFGKVWKTLESFENKFQEQTEASKQ